MKKKDVGWVSEAPQKCCSTCAKAEYVERKPFTFIWKCGLHGWVTKARAICDNYEERS